MNMAAEKASYGSYLIWRANRTSHQYAFVSFVNLTEFSSTINFPAFMYEAILRTSLWDSQFEFKVRSTGYPLTPE